MINADLVAVNDIQERLSTDMFLAVVRAMDECKQRNTNPMVYWAMLSTTTMGLLTSQARGLRLTREEFLETVTQLYDLSKAANDPTPPSRRDQ